MGNIVSISSLSAAGILLCLLIYYATHPEKLEKLGSLLYLAITWISAKYEKRHVALQAQSIINSFVVKTRNEIEGYNSPQLTIKWVNSEDVDAYFDNGRVIVRLRNHREKKENIITVAKAYIEEGIMKDFRIFLPDILCKSISNFSIAKILKKVNPFNSYQYFYRNTLQKSIMQDQDIKPVYQALEVIDNRGNFTRMLLREYIDFGVKNPFVLPTSQTKRELQNFFKWVFNLSKRGYGEDTPLRFCGMWIKCSVVFIAKRDTYELHGINAYLWRIQNNISLGDNHVYLQAMDTNISILNQVVESLRRYPQLTFIKLPTLYQQDNGIKREIGTYILFSRMQQIEAIDIFGNIEHIDGIENIYDLASDNTDPSDLPSSGYLVRKIIKYSSEYYVELSDLETGKIHPSKRIQTIDFVPLESLKNAISAITLQNTAEYISSSRHHGYFYRNAGDDSLDRIDYLYVGDNKKYYILYVIPEKAQDSICLDLYNELLASRK